MLAAKSVASAIYSNQMEQHNVKVSALIELLVNVFDNVTVQGVEVIDIGAWPFFPAVWSEPLAELRLPDVVTKKDNFGFVSVLAVKLVKDVVLLESAIVHSLSELKYGVQDA